MMKSRAELAEEFYKGVAEKVAASKAAIKTVGDRWAHQDHCENCFGPLPVYKHIAPNGDGPFCIECAEHYEEEDWYPGCEDDDDERWWEEQNAMS